MLRDFHLFDLLTQGGTITSTVFTGDADFLSAFRLVNGPSVPLHSVSIEKLPFRIAGLEGCAPGLFCGAINVWDLWPAICRRTAQLLVTV